MLSAKRVINADHAGRPTGSRPVRWTRFFAVRLSSRSPLSTLCLLTALLGVLIGPCESAWLVSAHGSSNVAPRCTPHTDAQAGSDRGSHHGSQSGSHGGFLLAIEEELTGEDKCGLADLLEALAEPLFVHLVAPTRRALLSPCRWNSLHPPSPLQAVRLQV